MVVNVECGTVADQALATGVRYCRPGLMNRRLGRARRPPARNAQPARRAPRGPEQGRQRFFESFVEHFR